MAGHTRVPKFTVEVFWSRVKKTRTCWLYQGPLYKNGYGKAGRQGLAHRYAYELLVGPIPAGMTLDHVADRCQHRNCVNPKHMEIVTRGENALRGNGPMALNARKTHCPKGHPYDEVNTYIDPKGKRRCRICRQRDTTRQTAKRRVKLVA